MIWANLITTPVLPHQADDGESSPFMALLQLRELYTIICQDIIRDYPYI